jgi:hypothetical protein
MCLSPDLSAVRGTARRGFASSVHVTQEGPDMVSLYCLVEVFDAGEAA